MSDNGQGGGYGLWTVIKAVLIVVGLIYLVSLLTWAVQWGVVALAVGGVGYLCYRVARAMNAQKALPPGESSKKLLATESSFDKRLRELENEERLLDHKIGL